MRGTAVLLRLIAAIGGGYVVPATLAAFAAVGLPCGEAVVLASMLAFLIHLALPIWSFAVTDAASWGCAPGLARRPPV